MRTYNASCSIDPFDRYIKFYVGSPTNLGNEYEMLTMDNVKDGYPEMTITRIGVSTDPKPFLVLDSFLFEALVHAYYGKDYADDATADARKTRDRLLAILEKHTC